MRILCDRCNKEYTNFECKQQFIDFYGRKDWTNIEVRQQGEGLLSDLYLCKKCTEDFYKFLNNDK